MAVQIVLAVLLLCLLAVLAVDGIPLALKWLSRIHIGRYPDRGIWNRQIVAVGRQWLRRTPSIPVTDQTRLIALDMLRGRYSKASIQHWQEAALLLGLIEQMENVPSAEDALAVETRLAAYFRPDGGWREAPKLVDGAILAYALMKAPSFDAGKYRQAMDGVWEMIQNHLGEDGTVKYRNGMPDYRYVDTIGFICPFLVRYGLLYGRPECLELAVRQITEFERRGMLADSPVPFHAYSVKEGHLLGLQGWGRGIAWYAIGLMDAWKELPGDHPGKERLQQAILHVVPAVLKLQGSGGQWNWSATRPEARADSSATAVLGWFLLEASAIDSIAAECRAAAEAAAGYLMKMTRRSGVVDFSQGDTKDIGVYSVLFERLPFTQGFSIRLSARLARRTSS
ncbi:glycoside hydrolase family 88 protein [Paenibacillus glufosinatiresistens]|uniref:glycoside hydrolase family 88 protein n=1 Tax=Paenibacillus glufosinatiresistens TaxID=3070657 RepID=UPI00286E559F|nr:glycoside hydrolase family 88 protein [Paenibacillus sp. YX.27]